MRLTIKGVFCIFLLLVFTADVVAQKIIKYQQFSIENGLSQNTINAIFQDSKGFMWFGTQNGLNKFDASTFKIFKNSSTDTTSIGSNDVYSIFEDREKSLWFGTSAGLSRYNRETENFSNFDFIEGGQYSIRPAWCMAGSSKDNKLWVGASGGLFSFNTVTKEFNHFKIDDSIQNANSIRAMCMDKIGRIWVVNTLGNLLQFDTIKHVFEDLHSFGNTRTIGDAPITSIMADGEGYIWIGRDDGLVVRYDYNRKIFNYYSSLKDKFPIRVITEDKESNICIGTDKGGAFLLDKTTGQFIAFSDRLDKGTDVVLSFFNDAKGDLWLGTYNGGAFLFDKADTAFDHFSPYDEIKQKDENNSVLSILQDGDDLWIGTDGGGLIRKGKRLTKYYKKGELHGVAGNTIICMKPGDDQNIYFGTYADGLTILNKNTEKFKNYNQYNGLSDNSVWALYYDNGFVWIGTNKGGLNLLDVKKGTFKHFTNTMKDERSISSNTIRSIFKDSRGRLWIGTFSGLNVFHEDDSTFTNYNGRGLSSINILSIYEDSKKNVWFGTYGGGINKYDYHTDAFTAYQEKDGLAGNIVYGILEDSQGNLWLSTNKGVSKFDTDKVSFKNFDTRSGLSNAQFNLGAYFKNKEGKMFFGNVEGVTSFFPHHIRENGYLPPIVITDFQLFNKPVVISSTSPLRKSISESREIILEHTQSVFSFKFSALNFTHANKNNFAYKLEPFDDEWNYVDNTQTATYTNLDPGTYTFKVKGSNNDNVWNEKYASVTVVVTPPYWKTLWFRILSTALLIFIIYSIYQIKVSNIRKQKEILTKLVEQRTDEIEERNKLLFETQIKNAELTHQKLNHELENKSKELTNYTLLIIQKNKLLDELKKKLKEAIRNPGTNNLRDFKNLVKLINYNFSPEKEWNEFNLNFNRIHKGFADSLKSAYPDLTNNDLRLCALYSIDIPTKDIAEAMGISQNSVKMARYRLRKKLNLNPDKDLTAFLRDSIQTS